MGIEGEQLVFDYLSRVGDLAHGTNLSAAERAALVGRLRDEIGRKRAEAGGAESQADVRRVLRGVGRPEDVVAAASGADGAPAPAVPAPRPSRDESQGEFRDEHRGEHGGEPRDGDAARGAEPPAGGKSAAREPRRPFAALRRPVPAQRTESPPAEPAAVPLEKERRGEPPEHPEWPEPARAGETYWPDGQIGRFTGGIEIPEMLRPPTDERPDLVDVPAVPGQDAERGGAPTEQAPGAPGTKRRRWRRVAGAARTKRVGGPIELLAAVTLLTGAVLGELLALGAGWLLAYWSPRLSRREAQWGTFGMPGLVGGGYLVWLFGRSNGYWGAPLEDGALEDAFAEHWPWLLRAAAVASAAFLLYRARRQRT